MSKTAVITCIFNHKNNNARVINWHMWYDYMKKFEIDQIISVEVSEDGNFMTDSSIKLKQPDLFVENQKEAILNIAISKLEHDIENVIWCDSDVLFYEDNWLENIKESLKENNITQCFSTIDLLNEDMEIKETWQSAMNTKDPNVKTKAGYCWAAKRHVVEHKLYENNIAGSGDVSITLAANGVFASHWVKNMNRPMRQNWLKWGAGFYQATKGKVGVVNNKAYHLFHGEEKNYFESENTLIASGFDPEKDIRKTNEGILVWIKTN